MAWKKGLRKFYQASSNFLSDNTVVLQHTNKLMHSEVKVLLSHWHTRVNGWEFLWSLLLNPWFMLIYCAADQQRGAEGGEHCWPLLQCTENSILRASREALEVAEVGLALVKSEWFPLISTLFRSPTFVGASTVFIWMGWCWYQGFEHLSGRVWGKGCNRKGSEWWWNTACPQINVTTPLPLLPAFSISIHTSTGVNRADFRKAAITASMKVWVLAWK